MNGILLTLPKNQVRQPVEYFDYTGWSFTHDFILEWLKGKCKEVILVGAADFDSNEHYNVGYKFHYSEQCKENSVKYIESITDYKIYKANPKGILNIPVREL